MKTCHKCGTPWETGKKLPGVKEFCPQCTAYLHCCHNCRFHDRTRPNQCLVPNTEAIADRAGANFCDEFEFRDTATIASDGAAQDAARQRAAALLDAEVPDASKQLNSLFGDEQPAGPRSFDDLFRE